MALYFWILAALLSAVQRPTPPAARAVVSGKVVLAGTNQPVAGARVTLRPAALSTTTNSAGEFRLFPAAGRYTIEIEREGFVVQPDPQRGVTEFGMGLVLAGGQQRSDVLLAMIPAPVISGYTFFPNGEPLAAAVVEAYRTRYTPDGPRMRIVQTALTDDRGHYRLFGLRFGEFLVSATYNRRAQRAALDGIRLSPNVPDPDDGYATVFYPRATSASEAEKIRLAPGVAAGDLGIVLRDSPRYRIRGRVIYSLGLPSDLRIIFVPEGRDLRIDDEGSFVSPGADGSFSISGVSPGSYALIASSPQYASDIVPIRILDADVDGLNVPLLPTTRVQGRISPANDSRTNATPRVILRRSTREIELSMDANSALDGTFTIGDVGFGEYEVAVESLPPGMYVSSIRSGPRDVLAGRLQVGVGPDVRLDITLSSRGATVQGRVIDRVGDPARGAQVVLVPEYPYRRRPDRYITGLTDDDGVFQLNSVPPGSYSAFAFEKIESGAFYAFAYDPVTELRFSNRAMRVNVREVQSTSLELRVVPAAETAGGL
jgi:hypothetical protein